MVPLFLTTQYGPARAEVVYPNLADSGSCSVSFNGSSGLAQNFTNTASAAAVISEVKLNFYGLTREPVLAPPCMVRLRHQTNQ